MVSNSPLLTTDNLIEYIARGHAFDKHVMGTDNNPEMRGVNAFRATETNAYFDKDKEKKIPAQHLGSDLFIETPDDLADYIKNSFLESPSTTGYVSPHDGGVNLYNSEDNVAVHFSWKNKAFDFGTIYRYPATAQRFENVKDDAEDFAAVNGISFTAFDNAGDSNAAIKAVGGMVRDINAHPEKYLFNPCDQTSTIADRVLENVSRPGRTWKHDKVLHAAHNVRGHSQAYAQAHDMDIPTEEFERVQCEMDKEINIGRVTKSMRSSKLLEVIKGNVNFTPRVELSFA